MGLFFGRVAIAANQGGAGRLGRVRVTGSKRNAKGHLCLSLFPKRAKPFLIEPQVHARHQPCRHMVPHGRIPGFLLASVSFTYAPSQLP